MPIRLLIGDDDPLIREALEIIFSRDGDFTLLASASNGRDAAEACLAGRVDVALLDIRMPVLDGIAAAEKIRAGSKTRILLLSTFHDPDLVQRAVAAGASGYLLKGCTKEEIKQAVLLVHSGHTVFHSEVFDEVKAGSRNSPGDISFLSERERDLVKLIAEGYSNRQAAEELGISEGTVKNHISGILDKLGLRQRTQIAIYFMTGRKDFS
jgi:DNA-binding NarL/FixJ family response regulator